MSHCVDSYRPIALWVQTLFLQMPHVPPRRIRANRTTIRPMVLRSARASSRLRAEQTSKYSAINPGTVPVASSVFAK